VAGVRSGQGVEGGDVREPRALRLVEEALERPSLQRGGEVEDRAGGRGDPDPVVGGGLAGEVAGAMDP
jgi:hypothetical protein